ncbi:MAG: ROK family protein [Gorillibacterium sp.]|nr:ROK family protein [Gorillibacterium sp.]
MIGIAVDFGGTHIKLGLMEQDTILVDARIPANSANGLLPKLDEVEKAINNMLTSIGRTLKDCVGIAIAMPGIVDAQYKRLLSINGKYEDGLEFNFSHWVSSRFGLPLVLENDARAALLGEVSYGIAKGSKDAVLVIFGTGIGTAAMIDGVLLRGKHHQAGILGGHLTTDIHGDRCTCGNLGCVEAQSGNWALPNRIRNHPDYHDSVLSEVGLLDYKQVLETAQKGDRVANRILDELILHWSAAIINMIHAYDPDTVILSGGLMNSADYLLPRIRDHVLKHVWTPWGKVEFKVAPSPEQSVLLGLTRLLYDSILS